MSKREATAKPGKGAFERILAWLTTGIGRITALIVGVTGLLVAIYEVRERWWKIRPPAPCVQAEPLAIPKTVKYSEWDTMRFKLRGRNTCVTAQGLYVTFVRRDLSRPSTYILRNPYSDLAECRGKTPLEEPRCWDPKRPVSKATGNWEFEIMPPPLERLSDRTEKLVISWGVRNSDAPTDQPNPTDTDTIEVRGDNANPL